MKRLWFLVPLFLLAACTGTSSVQPPMLLFITHSTGGVHTAALVVDEQGTDQRFDYLEDTETVLAGEPVALDMTDRAGARGQAVVLLRLLPHEYSAIWLDLSAIEPETAGPIVSAGLVDLTAELAAEVNDPADLCLTDLQTTRDGGLIALLNVPQECNSLTGATQSIFLVERDGTFLRELQATTSLLTSGLFIRQATVDEPDRLYFLDEHIGAARLNETVLPAGTNTTGAAFAAGSDVPAPLDFTFTNGSFAVLQSDALYVLEEGRVSVPQSSANNSFIPDPQLDRLPALLVLRSGSGSQLHVFQPAEAPTTVSIPVVASAGTVEPFLQWAYLLTGQGIATVDLMTILLDGTASGSVRSYTIAEAGEPGLISWVQGVLPPPAP